MLLNNIWDDKKNRKSQQKKVLRNCFCSNPGNMFHKDCCVDHIE